MKEIMIYFSYFVGLLSRLLTIMMCISLASEPLFAQHEYSSQVRSLDLRILDLSLKGFLKEERIKGGFNFREKICVRSKNGNPQRVLCLSKIQDELVVTFNVALLQDKGYEEAMDLEIISNWDMPIKHTPNIIVDNDTITLIEDFIKKSNLKLNKSTAVRKFSNGDIGAILKSGTISLGLKDSEVLTAIYIVSIYYSDVGEESELLIKTE